MEGFWEMSVIPHCEDLRVSGLLRTWCGIWTSLEGAPLAQYRSKVRPIHLALLNSVGRAFLKSEIRCSSATTVLIARGAEIDNRKYSAICGFISPKLGEYEAYARRNLRGD